MAIMATTHKLTIGSKFTRMLRRQKPGYGHVTSQSEITEEIKFICDEKTFVSDSWNSSQYSISNIVSIEGTPLQDGDSIEILLSEVAKHNKCKEGDSAIVEMIRWDSDNRFKEHSIGTVTSTIIL